MWCTGTGANRPWCADYSGRPGCGAGAGWRKPPKIYGRSWPGFTWRGGPSARRRSGAQATNLGRLAALGYTDAWRADEAEGTTWTGPRGEAFRLDYVVVSASLTAGLRGGEVVHADRAEGLSDHAALAVELDPGC